MKGSQIAGSQILVNWLGYIFSEAPAPTVIFCPTRENAQELSQTRVDPMIASTPSLRERISMAGTRDSRNSTFTKRFLGATLRMRGANSPAGMRQFSARNLGGDDVDGWQGTVLREGDPVDLIRKRARTFPNRKILWVSTPTLKGFSRIERLYDQSNQQHYYIPCPECGHMDYIQWREGGYSGREGKHHSIDFEPSTFNPADPEAVKLRCAECRRLISESWKTQMLERGEWRPTAEGSLVGWHLPSMYSPAGWTSWRDIADDFLKSKDDQMSLQVWVNHQLAETWEEPGDTNDQDTLFQRREKYAAEVPDRVGALFLSADVHKDRIEAMVWGFGAGEECWAIAEHVILGDPEKGLMLKGNPVARGPGSVWAELHDFLGTKFRHESGQLVGISGGAIDAGYLPDAVYQFCRAHYAQKVYPTRGASIVSPGDPFIRGFSTKNTYRARVYSLNTAAGKDIVHGRLQIPKLDVPGPRPGYIHFPIADWTDEEFFAQMVAEKRMGRYVKGKGVMSVWLNRRPGKRNEKWDLTILGLAALRIRGPRFVETLGARATQLERRVQPQPAPAAPPSPGQVRQGLPMRPRRRGGWVGGFRR